MLVSHLAMPTIQRINQTRVNDGAIVGVLFYERQWNKKNDWRRHDPLRLGEWGTPKKTAYSNLDLLIL